MMTDWPTMPDVILMISNEHAPRSTYVIHKKPAFTGGRNVMDTNSIIDSIVGNCSKNNIIISTTETQWLIPILKKRGVVEAISVSYFYASSYSIIVILLEK